jgi:hypothetical protein
MAASQHASTRSQHDAASVATCSGAAKAAVLEPSSAAAMMIYFFMFLTPLIF